METPVYNIVSNKSLIFYRDLSLLIYKVRFETVPILISVYYWQCPFFFQLGILLKVTKKKKNLKNPQAVVAKVKAKKENTGCDG